MLCYIRNNEHSYIWKWTSLVLEMDYVMLYSFKIYQFWTWHGNMLPLFMNNLPILPFANITYITEISTQINRYILPYFKFRKTANQKSHDKAIIYFLHFFNDDCFIKSSLVLHIKFVVLILDVSLTWIFSL